MKKKKNGERVGSDPGHRPFNLPIIVSVSIPNLLNLFLQNYCQTCCCRPHKSFGLVENIPTPLTSAGDPLVLRFMIQWIN